MENYDSLFQEQSNAQPFDKEAWAEQKRKERQELFDTIDVMADKALSDTGTLADYLTMQSKLGRTSVGNTLLVLSQKPDATYIADYGDWQKKGRSVKKGEKGLQVLEADGEYTRDDGSMGVSFKAKSVFDVSQTYGQQLRQSTNVPAKTLLRALMTDTPVPVKLSDNVTQDIGARYSREEKTVYVARGLDGNTLFKLIASELAHAEMNGSDPHMAEFGSSCVANIVYKRYDMDGPEPERIPQSISSLSVQDKRSILRKIREVACDMSERIDKNLYTERQKQRSQNEPQR